MTDNLLDNHPENPQDGTAPVTATTDIDWLRSTTTKRIERTKNGEPVEAVNHQAVFGIKPESLEDLPVEYSLNLTFRPEFMTVTWEDAVLVNVRISGPQRLKSGGVSDKISRHQTYRHYSGLDRLTLPLSIARALEAYEIAVSTMTGAS